MLLQPWPPEVPQDDLWDELDQPLISEAEPLSCHELKERLTVLLSSFGRKRQKKGGVDPLCEAGSGQAGPEECLPAKEDSNPQRNIKANSQPPQAYGQFCAECGGPINQ
mgnify:FL=1